MKFEFSNSGSPIRVIRSGVFKDGHMVVEETGKENFQEYIDSFEDSCNIESLVARAVNGEPELLQKRQANYGDFTNMPKTFAEVCQRIIDAKAFFDTLPADRKAAFDNDPMTFIASFDDPSFFEKAGFTKSNEIMKDPTGSGEIDNTESKNE